MSDDQTGDEVGLPGERNRDDLDLLHRRVLRDGRFQLIGDVRIVDLARHHRVDDVTAHVRREAGQNDIAGALRAGDLGNDRLGGNRQCVGVLRLVGGVELRLGKLRER